MKGEARDGGRRRVVDHWKHRFLDGEVEAEVSADGDRLAVVVEPVRVQRQP